MRTQIIYNTLPDTAVTAAWKSYLSAHPRGNIFQSCGFYTMWFHIPYHEPLAVIAFDNRETVCGIMQGVIIREPGPVMRHLTSRAIAWGGPVADDDNIAELLVIAYEKTLGRRVIYSQIRPIGTQPVPDVFPGCGFKTEPHLNIINDLTAGEEKMMNLLQNERRRKIKRAKSKGVVVRLAEDGREITAAVSLILGLYRRIGLPAPPEQLLTMGKEILGDALKVFIADFEGTVVGTRLILCYREMLYDWYAADDPAYRDKHINDLLPWEVMLWASRNGFHIFDFGGAGNPDEEYGVRDFKLRFGGMLIENPRFISIHKPLLMFAGEKGIKAYRAFKKKR